MKDLNKLSKEIYEANKAKGFHDEKHSEEHMMCLVISELMEAVEADRKGRRADLKAFYKNGASERYLHNENYSEAFQLYVKDTVEDELSDAVIRLLDTAGALGFTLDLEKVDEIAKGFDKGKSLEMKFTECIYVIVFAIVDTPYYYSSNATQSIRDGLALIIGYCNALNIDLWKHVELKLKYNSLRPYKHGKAY